MSNPYYKSFWQRHGRAILWGIAVAGILISILTRFRFTFIFLPLIFAPGFFGRKRDDDRE